MLKRRFVKFLCPAIAEWEADHEERQPLRQTILHIVPVIAKEDVVHAIIPFRRHNEARSSIRQDTKVPNHG
jgi:sensor histidine kinase regulating citrate/malate metabolism